MLQKNIEIISESNEKMTEIYSIEGKKKPFVAIVSTNPDDEPSERYMRNKVKKLKDNKCEAQVYSANDDKSLVELIKTLNQHADITSIIIQAPFGEGIKMPAQDVFDLVVPEKDIDRLHSKWYYDKNEINLPLTALGIYRLIEKQFSSGKRILFYGNGLTTNKRLFLKMFDEGIHDCRIANSKTPDDSVKELIEWADIIVSATGIPEILECEGKHVISPTIAKTEDGFRGDLKHDLRDKNHVHNVLGGIGKLTTSMLIRRAYEDI